MYKYLLLGIACAFAATTPVDATQYGPFGLSIAIAPPSQTLVEKPGPSQDLFDNPYYSCVTNRYVGNFGQGTPNNGNDGQTMATPWATLDGANAGLPSPAAGYCVNVAPGTYPNGAELTKGGNLASATGYLVYRCTTMNACTVTASDHGFCWGSSCGTTSGPNYVIIDGFTMTASTRQSYGQGIQLWNGVLNSNNKAAHHVWIINNIISNYGQSGVQMNDGEYFYVIHNKTFNNAWVTCDARGSGISFVTLKAFSGYTPTADDLDNPKMGVTGPNFPFKNAALWNDTHNNSTTNCGVSDGNGIIWDSLANQDVTAGVDYPNRSLSAFNLIYNNGGSGTQTFFSSHVTIANNSTFNNYDNLNITDFERAELDTSHGKDNLFINNIAVSRRSGNEAYIAGFSGGSCASPNVCGVFQNNASICNGSSGAGCSPTFQSNPAFSCSANKCDPAPLYVNVGNTSNGSDTTPPNGANFALQAGSPAIGYAQPQPYLQGGKSPLDAGACDHTLTTCP
jgi:hypothetical protein